MHAINKLTRISADGFSFADSFSLSDLRQSSVLPPFFSKSVLMTALTLLQKESVDA